MGDSEVAEGSVWEAMEAAAFHAVDNLTAILDLNRLGQRGPTMHEWRADTVRATCPGVRLALDRDRRTRRRLDRPCLHGGSGRRQAHADRGAYREGPRGLVPGQPGGMARQGGSGRPRGRGHRGARGRSDRSRHAAPRPEPYHEIVLGEPDPSPRPPTTRRSPRARRSARPSRGSPAIVPTSSSSTARSATPRTPRTSRRWPPSGSWRCTSPSSAWWGCRRACRRSGRRRSPRPSARSSRGLPTSCAWARSAARTCGSAGLTPASRSARTGRRRWRWRISPCSARCTDPRCCIRPTATPPCKLVSADVRPAGHLLHPDHARGDAAPVRRRRGVPHRRVEDPAAGASTTSPRWWAPASRCHECLAAADRLAGEGSPSG